jgi:hypothetical protein
VIRSHSPIFQSYGGSGGVSFAFALDIVVIVIVLAQWLDS